MIHQIVIIGGGFGGVRVAKSLAKWGRDIHITLVDKNRYHTFYPNLYEVATAHVLESANGHKKIDFHELFSSSSCSFDEIFLDDLNVSFFGGEVTNIDFQKQEIYLKSNVAIGMWIKYDFLVIGIGSETNYFDIPGLYEYSIPLKNLTDALLVRNSLDELFANSPKNKILKIVIGGGGFTGCEFAGELVGFLKKLSQIHGWPKFYFECSIIDGANNLLSGGASAWAQKKAQKHLSNLGVKLILGQKIKEVKKGEIFLENNIAVEYNLLIWAGGVKKNTLSKNKIFADSFLRISPYENVFGVGDAIYFINEKIKTPLPMTASMALKEAKYVALNIKRAIQKKILLNYKSKFPGFIIPLGRKYAIFENGPLHISGFLPWILKDLISLNYWISILGFRNGFRIWRRGLQIFVKND